MRGWVGSERLRFSLKGCAEGAGFGQLGAVELVAAGFPSTSSGGEAAIRHKEKKNSMKAVQQESV